MGQDNIHLNKMLQDNILLSNIKILNSSINLLNKILGNIHHSNKLILINNLCIIKSNNKCLLFILNLINKICKICNSSLLLNNSNSNTLNLKFNNKLSKNTIMSNLIQLSNKTNINNLHKINN